MVDPYMIDFEYMKGLFDFLKVDHTLSLYGFIVWHIGVILMSRLYHP
jgi:hypothetical protein